MKQTDAPTAHRFRRCAEPVVAPRCLLGESPRWAQDGSGLWWVDIAGKRLHSMRHDGSSRSWILDVTPTCLAFGAKDELILCADMSIGVMDREQGRIARNMVEVPKPENLVEVRTNDARVDYEGQLWFGTMATDGHTRAGSLYRTDGIAVDRMLSDIAIVNGICWSLDGRYMYVADSVRSVVLRCEIDPSSNQTARPEVFLDFTVEAGFPDGLSIDASGSIWVAMWGLGEVRRYGPDALLREVLEVPGAPLVTAMCLGGPDLSTIFITTAQSEEPGPLEGSLYKAAVSVAGVPENRLRRLPEDSC